MLFIRILVWTMYCNLAIIYTWADKIIIRLAIMAEIWWILSFFGMLTTVNIFFYLGDWFRFFGNKCVYWKCGQTKIYTHIKCIEMHDIHICAFCNRHGNIFFLVWIIWNMPKKIAEIFDRLLHLDMLFQYSTNFCPMLLYKYFEISNMKSYQVMLV